MTQEERAKNDTEAAPAAASPAASDAKREVSSIAFPYGDQDDSVVLAKAVHSVGGQSCQVEQLAGYLKVAASGGAFRARLAYPRIFGLTEFERGTVSLTPLGLRIVDQSQEAAARVESFLAVPLYKAIYEKYKGYTLPPAAALEREMASFGVSSKQTDKARQVFERSARQAGFYWAGPDRLTLPVIKGAPPKPETRPLDDAGADQRRGNGGGGGGGDLHPFIQGLLLKLPKPDTEWKVADQAKWLQTAASIFGLIYQSDGYVEVTPKPVM